MSSDDGWLIRENDNGMFVLQHYFASADDYPDINDPNALTYLTLDEATRNYARMDSGEYISEYGLRVLLSEGPTNKFVDRACKVMHDCYEAAAVEAGWETNKTSRVPWTEVPEGNKKTMRIAVSALLVWIEMERR